LAQCSQKPSDYSFVNLWGWGREYGMEWSFQGRLCPAQADHSADPVLGSCRELGETDWGGLLESLPPEHLFHPHSRKAQAHLGGALYGIVVEECREHWDYLYDVTELTELKGRKFHNKKNLLNQFLRDHEAGS
jgi:uncharacterized protein